MIPGNPVVGSTVLRRPAIQSPAFVHNSAGWNIAADGSAEFNNVVIRGTISGTDFLIDPSGDFFLLNSHGNTIALFSPANGGAGGLWAYADTGAVQGALVASVASAAGTDTVTGAAYPAGLAVYTTIAGTTYAVQLGESTVNGSPTPGLFLDNQGASPPAQPPVYSFGNADSSGAAAVIYSGEATGGSTASSIEVADSTLSGVAGGAVVISSGNLSVDSAGNVVVKGTLSVNGSGNTGTSGLTDGTINGTSGTSGLTNGQIAGTSGGASAGTAHTHGPGSFAVTNGQHNHGAGGFAVANGTHNHVL